MAVALRDLCRALNAIGIETQERPGSRGFLDDVRIERGRILHSPGARASNILHEAGHLACLPPMFRHRANDDLDDIARTMCAYADERIALTLDPEEPIIRAIMQCSDPEATAWAWAFGTHLGMKPEDIIEDHDYDGDGAHVRLQVSTGMYIGINGLRAAGMIDSVKSWPNMTKWLQDAEEGPSQ